MAYASKYYDPQKAHEYYEAHKKTSSRTSTAKLNDKGKETAKYVKQKLKEEKAEKIAQLKEQMQAKIDTIKAQLKALPTAERKALHDMFYGQISDLRAGFKSTKADLKEDYDNKYVEELDKIKADKSMRKK